MPGNLYDRLSRRLGGGTAARWLRELYLVARRLLERLGFELVLTTYDSPIPDLRELPPAYFEQPRPMRGIDFDIAHQMEFLERYLAPYLREFRPPVSADEAGPHRFYLGNGAYVSVDAELLYAIVRHFRPKRVVELGSGFSTLIIREALERGDGAPALGTLRTYDPFRSPVLPEDAPVTPLPAQEVPDETFRELQAGDVLFVDTSHTVKVGGDVNRIVLEVLPVLQPGVLVHFHDIFLPHPYSRGHIEDGHFWSEQYLLQAFLTENPWWEVLVAAHAVAHEYPERLAELIASFNPGVNPACAFWIRRRETPPKIGTSR